MCGRYQIILNGLLFVFMPVWWCLSKSLEQSAQTSIYLASDRRLAHVTGKYFRWVDASLARRMHAYVCLVIATNVFRRACLATSKRRNVSGR